MRKLPARFTAAHLILVVGFAFSLAANLLWTWPGGPVRILGGALASLALPGAIHLWEKIPLPPPLIIPVWRWQLRLPVMRGIRALAMTGIAGMAAYTTFSHASHLLIQHGEEPILATLYPVMTELLVVMGVLASKKPAVVRPSQKQSPRRDVQVTPAAATPKPSPLHEVGKPPSKSAQAREWLRAEYAAGRTPTGADADQHFGLKGDARCGARALKKVLEERERQAV